MLTSKALWHSGHRCHLAPNPSVMRLLWKPSHDVFSCKQSTIDGSIRMTAMTPCLSTQPSALQKAMISGAFLDLNSSKSRIPSLFSCLPCRSLKVCARTSLHCQPLPWPVFLEDSLKGRFISCTPRNNHIFIPNTNSCVTDQRTFLLSAVTPGCCAAFYRLHLHKIPTHHRNFLTIYNPKYN